jgi:hypothetical protein
MGACHSLLMMDAAAATIVDGGQAMCQKQESIRNKLLAPLFYQMLRYQAKALLSNHFQRGSLHQMGQIHSSFAIRGPNGSPL